MIEAEKSVLGSIILNNDTFYEVAQILRPEDFYDPDARECFVSILSLAEEGRPFDATTLRAVERPHILEYAETVPTASNAVHYARLVRDASLRRGLTEASDRIKRLAASEEQLDLVLRQSEELILNVRRPEERGDLVSVGDVSRELFPEIERRSEETNPLSGPSSGFKNLDSLLSGLSPGELVILAGRPAMGKTALALQIASRVAQSCAEAVYVAELEMSKEQLTTRLYSQELGIPINAFQKGKLSEAGFDELAALCRNMEHWNLWIDDRGYNSVSGILAACRRLKRQEGGIKLVVVDYLQLMDGVGDNREQTISGIARGLKLAAKELECPVVALSQLNRGVEHRVDKRPLMSDLRESGAIEQDADEILFVYRDEYYNEDSPDKGIAEVIVAKNRDGPIGTAKLLFQGECTRFQDFNPGTGEIHD